MRELSFGTYSVGATLRSPTDPARPVSFSLALHRTYSAATAVLHLSVLLRATLTPDDVAIARTGLRPSLTSASCFYGDPAEMSEEKRAELYTSPGGRFIRADTLPRVLAHWRSLRKTEKEKHFIKYEGELYLGDEVEKLQT